MKIKKCIFSEGTVVKAPIPEYTDKSTKVYIHLKTNEKNRKKGQKLGFVYIIIR